MVAGGLVAATCTAQMGPMPGMHGAMMGGSPVRRTFVMRYGVDPKYARMTNPLPPTRANADAGRRLYSLNCVACHGERGYGDGPAAGSLNPPAAKLVGIGGMPMVGDGYLFWTIADGGRPLGTAMPAYKGILGRSDIWKIVLFLRTL